MCQLLGLSFNRPVTATFALRGLEAQVEGDPMYRNRNGWGIALFQENAALVIKEPISANASSLFSTVRSFPLTSSTILAHIRFSTMGRDTLRNTHPFQREVHGHEVVFGHNGTLCPEFAAELPLARYRPLGETDSEHAFLYLIEQSFTEEGLRMERFREAVARVNRLGELNFLLARGEWLYAYHCRTGYKGLYALHRKPPHGPARLIDSDLSFDFSTSDYQHEQGFIVASTPLTDETWEPFQPGELQVFHQGRRTLRLQV